MEDTEGSVPGDPSGGPCSATELEAGPQSMVWGHIHPCFPPALTQQLWAGGLVRGFALSHSLSPWTPDHFIPLIKNLQWDLTVPETGQTTQHLTGEV